MITGCCVAEEEAAEDGVEQEGDSTLSILDSCGLVWMDGSGELSNFIPTKWPRLKWLKSVKV
jgi:hypothetical protein